jgi:hypothetical protein
VVSFTPPLLYFWGTFTRTHWIAGWLSLRTGLDDMERTKISPLLVLELQSLGSPARSQKLYRLQFYISICVCVNYFIKLFIRKNCCKLPENRHYVFSHLTTNTTMNSKLTSGLRNKKQSLKSSGSEQQIRKQL